MILAYHCIFTAYGFWLPNDPRGSRSDFVRSRALLRFGNATKVSDTRSHAAVSHDYEVRQLAKEHLKYPPVVFTGRQALEIARGFADAIDQAKYILHECSILPAHVHMVLKRDGRDAEDVIGHLKRSASRRLRKEGLHPFQHLEEPKKSLPSPWARRGWPVFLDTVEAIIAAIRYVAGNPERERKPPQQWPFVVPYIP